MSPVRGYISSYPPRLRQYANALLTPVTTPLTQAPPPGRTKRGTTAVNYAEDLFDDDDFDDEGRRPTGLRSLRREDSVLDRTSSSSTAALGQEAHGPVEMQGVFRDWMIKRMVRPGYVSLIYLLIELLFTDTTSRCSDQLQVQAQLPLTLVPIRIDLEVPAHQPLEPFPVPPRGSFDSSINPTLPGYRRPEPLPPFRIKDTFLWNLHEALATPDDFSGMFVRDLDLPNPQAMTVAISSQIRQQLEEYAGVALHPLFQQTPSESSSAVVTNGATTTTKIGRDNFLNPDDTYRCLIHLNINLQNKLYTDKFEWSLLHPAGMAEEFAKVTCADLGLGAEWVSAIAHGIYEAVLRLKKEVCESSAGGFVGLEIDNQVAAGSGMELAGWRYDAEGLGDEWEPKVETLSKEEIERREGDRERQIRRLRRETARFSSTAGLQQHGGVFDLPIDGTGGIETPLGRGERSKRKRKMRSLSPSGTPGTRATPDTAGYGGGGGGTLTDWYVYECYLKKRLIC